jgi:hypothetical protein
MGRNKFMEGAVILGAASNAKNYLKPPVEIRALPLFTHPCHFRQHIPQEMTG